LDTGAAPALRPIPTTEPPNSRNPSGALVLDPRQSLDLSDGVKREPIGAGRERLVNEKSGRVIQVGGQASAILDLIEGGTCLEALIEQFQRSRQGGPDISPKIMAFVSQLGEAGMLRGIGAAASGPRKLVLPNPDPFARAMARILVMAPPAVQRAAAAVVLIGAGIAIFTMLATGRLAPLGALANWTVLIAIPIMVLLIVFHEGMHAVVARMNGVPIVEAGIIIRGFRPPAFFVRSSTAFLSLAKPNRMRICLAGPAADVFLLGGLSVALLTLPAASAWRPVLTLTFLAKALGTTGNLSPFPKSDMSDALAAFFDDYFIARSSLSRGKQGHSKPKDIAAYRLILGAFVALALMFWILVIVSEINAGWFR
jgi:hypothetical protein